VFNLRLDHASPERDKWSQSRLTTFSSFAIAASPAPVHRRRPEALYQCVNVYHEREP
jgi:hypothetical protein